MLKRSADEYYLTKYAAVLLNALDEVRKGVTNIPEDSLFRPIATGKRNVKETPINYADLEAGNACGHQILV